MSETAPAVQADSRLHGRPAAARWRPRVVTAATVVAFVVLGAVVATWTLVHPLAARTTQPNAPVADALQSDAAKVRVCSAFDIVLRAVALQTNNDLGSDPVARAAVAANARLATLGGGDYLLSRLDPGTPAELASAVRGFADVVQDIGMNQLVGVANDDPRQATLLSRAQESSTRISKMCS
ncbi:hypothetical protein [Mycolicibacterium sp. 050158]|uniref:hypothetical protein n=1 Tax=Mycolicibacterium sp. 050158 TaxID=3090602 RepID=UPI00299D455F|nr:hypothetical protein [Mycolicibacterium sp. 050158]MDX1889961.1 hypothetical protein [Mycolicibacterium sp. 050158]